MLHLHLKYHLLPLLLLLFKTPVRVVVPAAAIVTVGIADAAPKVAVPVIVDATAPIAPSKVAVPVVTFIDVSVFVVPIAELNVTPPEVFEAFKTPLIWHQYHL